MNGASPMAHEEARELLPWLVNDTLQETERERVREHATSCVLCRRELDELEALQASLRQAAAEAPVPAPDMRRINARIDALLERDRGRERLAASVAAFLGRPWRIAFAAQSMLLAALLAVVLWPEPDTAEFTTLTDPDTLPPGAHIRVVFDPALEAADVQALVDDLALEFVAGPSARGVATLAYGEHADTLERRQAIERLLERPGVLFAEPVGDTRP